MTAHWESVLTQISEKQCRYQDFMQPLVGTLYQLIDQARSTPVKRFREWSPRAAGRRNRSKEEKRSQKYNRLNRRPGKAKPPPKAALRPEKARWR